MIHLIELLQKLMAARRPEEIPLIELSKRRMESSRLARQQQVGGV
jgi:hypothetical protein